MAALLALLFALPQEPPPFPVRLSGSAGYVSLPSGELVRGFYHDETRSFSEGLAAVRSGDRWSYLTAEGYRAFEADFAQARSFHDGCAAVAVRDEEGRLRWGHVDINGEWIGEGPRWTEVGDFSDGRAAVFDGQTGGYVDTSGVLVIQPKFGIHALPEPNHIRRGAFVGGVGGGIAHGVDGDGETLLTASGQLVPGEEFWYHVVEDEEGGELQIRLLGDDGGPIHDDVLEGVVPVKFGWIPARKDGLWGYLDARGEWVLPPRYAEAWPFSAEEALALARSEPFGPYGYIDPVGEWAIEPQYRMAAPFERGFARVQIGNDDAYIDPSGVVVWHPVLVPIQDWERIGPEVAAGGIAGSTESDYVFLGKELIGIYRSPEDAIAVARRRPGAEVAVLAGPETQTCSLYDCELPAGPLEAFEGTRRLILIEADPVAEEYAAMIGFTPGQILRAANFRYATMSVRLLEILHRDAPQLADQLTIETPRGWECVQDGPILETHDLTMIGGMPEEEVPRNESTDPFPMANESGTGFQYYDLRTFDPVFETSFAEAYEFSEGLARVKQHGFYGFIGHDGEWSIVPKFAVAGDFSEGRCIVAVEADGLMGFCDTRGEVVIPCVHHTLGSFHDGRALVLRDGKWGFLDRDGNEVIEAKYEWAGDFAEGLAPVKLDGLVGYVNRAGETVVPHQWLVANTHVGGLATALAEDRTVHYLDASGQSVITGAYENATDFLGEWALVQERDGPWYLIDRSGARVIDVREYE